VDLSWDITALGASPTAQPKLNIVRYADDPISSGKPVVAETALEVGQKLQVEWEKQWWHGEILNVLDDGTLKIHYTGWDSKWDEVVPRSRLQLANTTYIARHPGTEIGKVIGDGHCVKFVVRVAKAPVVSEWQPGIPVKGNGHLIPKGTAIATFVNGRYPDDYPADGRHMHAAIYDGQDKDGIWVWDQWVGHAVGRRQIHFRSGEGLRSNDGDAFSVIELRK
jgi:hypothetical protein